MDNADQAYAGIAPPRMLRVGIEPAFRETQIKLNGPANCLFENIGSTQLSSTANQRFKLWLFAVIRMTAVDNRGGESFEVSG